MTGATLAVAVAGTAACGLATEEETASAEAATRTETVARSNHGVAITEPEVLLALERAGYGFGRHFGAAPDAPASELATRPAFGAVVETLERQLDAVLEGDDRAGVGMQHWHRVFDRRWLRSPRSRFALVAVTNRIDRATTGDCGEVRFVYRLEYDDPGEARAPGEPTSRMPMTAVVVIPQRGDCRAIARRWVALEELRGDALARAAARGPLARLPAMISLETNLQAVRWPAGIWAMTGGEGEMGGHGEYLLDVFRVSGDTATLAPLENTPDADALAQDPDARAALAAWIRENAAAIERGDARVPERFLATSAFSYGPRGLARLSNRPFARLFGDGRALGPLSLPGDGLVQSAAGLVRRLDELTCQGCHQTRSIAGFHVLGDERPGDRLDQLVVGASAHFHDELPWRAELLHAVADGRPFTRSRPFAERAKPGPERVGARCGLGDDPTFASWTCAPGLRCLDANGEREVGVCARDGAPLAGDLCEVNRVEPSEDPRSGRVTRAAKVACGDIVATGAGTCTGAFGGFPNGACTATCSRRGELRSGGEVICGTVPPTTFNDCLVAGRPFEECMRPETLMLRASCDVSRPCRDDYACTKAPGAPPGVGQCMPPYFLFQARVDGHD